MAIFPLSQTYVQNTQIDLQAFAKMEWNSNIGFEKMLF